MMNIAAIVKQSGLSRRALAEKCGCSAGTICNIISGKLPSNWLTVEPEFIRALEPFAPRKTILSAVASAAHVATVAAGRGTAKKEKKSMFIRKQTLSAEARELFGLVRDPFSRPQKPEDIFICNKNRYVRDTLRDAATNGNFLAVTGESGSGKSTLVDDLQEWIKIERKPVTIIKPQILALSESEKNGKPLKARDIAEAIILTVQPGGKMPSSNEQLFRRVKEVLIDAKPRMHLLLIEEAHELNTHTLKTLKRFWELSEGMRRLLSIVLIGQQELEDKLDSTEKNLREVVQRCDVVKMNVLPDVAAFLKFRFASAGVDVLNVFEPEALDALQQKLVVAVDNDGKATNMAFPLAIGNLATLAINEAVSTGEPKVTADVVRGISVI